MGKRALKELQRQPRSVAEEQTDGGTRQKNQAEEPGEGAPGRSDKDTPVKIRGRREEESRDKRLSQEESLGIPG